MECGFGPENRLKPPTCGCKLGFKDITTECEACPPEFGNCGGAVGITCEDTYYETGDTCSSCAEGCIRCADTPGNCSSCLDGYYLEGNTCTKCTPPCGNCLTDTYCFSCVLDVENRVSAPTCACK